MHAQVEEFVGRVKRYLPDSFRGKRVVEVGSFNINGSVRPFFEACQYTGVDWRSGPGVDIVCLSKDMPFQDNEFDVAISTETLEHDPYWYQTLEAMVRVVKPGGLLCITAAGLNREKHGVEWAPGGYYANIHRQQVQPFLHKLVLFEEDGVANDIRAAWIK